ncbi:MAG: hypothetical protein ACREOI_35115, partial [bacterium]
MAERILFNARQNYFMGVNLAAWTWSAPAYSGVMLKHCTPVQTAKLMATNNQSQFVMTSSPVLSAKNLSKSYISGDCTLTVLSHVTFS